MRGSALASIFQSTLPTRGSDAVDYYTKNVPYEISIHAPHEGERPFSLINNYYFAIRFQSTLPTRGSDIAGVGLTSTSDGFQSTLPTRGSDLLFDVDCPRLEVFQSTLPTRGSDTEVLV